MSSIEDNELPVAIVQRIMKRKIPAHIHIAKDAKTAIVKSATVFINYLTATAIELATSHRHKTLSAQDILEALDEMEFSDFIPALRQVLESYQNEIKQKRSSSVSAIATAVIESSTGADIVDQVPRQVEEESYDMMSAPMEFSTVAPAIDTIENVTSNVDLEL